MTLTNVSTYCNPLPLPGYHDPMYFADDDGRVFLYYGCGNRGIGGIEMDPAQPCRAVRERAGRN